MFRCLLPALSLTLFLAVSSAPAHAASSIHWLCWLGSQDDYNIHCLRESDPVLEDVDSTQSPFYDGAGTRDEFAAAGGPRNLARVPREAPGRYQRIQWSIPLYSMPFDVSEVELLAHAMMCGTDADCVVQFDRYERPVAAH